MTATKILKKIKDEKVAFVDFRFTDTLGKYHHISVPAGNVDSELLTDGKNFDGSSIEGWRGIENSDMVLVPDLTTAVIDPFIDEKTMLLTCDAWEPSGKKGSQPLPAHHRDGGDGVFEKNRHRGQCYFRPGTGVFYI